MQKKIYNAVYCMCMLRKLNKMKNIGIFCAFMLLISAFVGCIEFSTSKNLTIKDFHFCSEIIDQDDYIEHSKEYAVGEQVFMYFELEGFKKREDGTAQIFQTLTVYTPNGVPLMDDEGTAISNFIMIDQSFDATGYNIIWFDNHLWQIDDTWPKGTYNVNIVVEDRVANKDVSYTNDFIVT